MSPCRETLSENGINQEEAETRDGKRETESLGALALSHAWGQLSFWLSQLYEPVGPLCAQASGLGFLSLATMRILMATRPSGHVSLMATAHLFFFLI